MTEASFVPDISHTVTDFPFSGPAPCRRRAPGLVPECTDPRVAPSPTPGCRPRPRAPRLRCAPGSEMPRPIIPHIISLSRGQQIPINLPSKLFPILDQATLVEGWGWGATPPTHAPPAHLPPSLLTDPRAFPATLLEVPEPILAPCSWTHGILTL